MIRTKWKERTFTFDFPEGWIFNILERLRGTYPRLVAMTNNLPHERLILKPGGKWSIKEHIGHLIDLEDLHEGRVDDFLARNETLRAADMSNVRTESASHNDADLQILLKRFSSRRDQLIKRLEELDDQTQLFSSIHPRLKKSMRPVDMAYFTAEHDDHHLASISEIIRI
jgi:hypothetical protein